MPHEHRCVSPPATPTVLQEADMLALESEYLSRQLARLLKEMLAITVVMALLLLYSAIRDLSAIVSIVLVVLLAGYLAGVMWRCGTIRGELRAIRQRMVELTGAGRYGREE